LLVSVALAATLGVTLNFSMSSLPFLAAPWVADPTFGVLNTCLHAAEPSRTGYAVGRDAHRAASWSNDSVTVCTLEGSQVHTQQWRLGGVTLGAFDDTGVLWVVAQGPQLSSTLMRLSSEEPERFGETSAVSVVGASHGVVVLELSGRLLSVAWKGASVAMAELEFSRSLTLSTNADGTRVAVTGDGAVRIYDAQRLVPIRFEAPCDIAAFWWLRERQLALLQCRPDGMSLVLNVETGAQEVKPPKSRTPSRLVGPDGPYVETCDLLPCTATDPA
jgi:hypothetical protein